VNRHLAPPFIIILFRLVFSDVDQLCLSILVAVVQINNVSGLGFRLCFGLHEGRHDVGHFGNVIGRNVITDAGQLVVIA